MVVAVGNDHAGYEYKKILIDHLKDRGIETVDMGTDSAQSCDYPDYAKKVADEIVSGKADMGLLICGTGIGMSIAANKVKGIRAAVVTEEFSCEATRSHNDSNILCLGTRVLSPEKAIKLLDIFLDTPFSEGENHKRRIEKVKALE